MRPPTTSYPHGYSNNQHGGSTSVKSHFLLPILGWAVKTYHCARHAEHYSATNPPRGRIRRVSYPEIPRTRPYPFPVGPLQPVLDQLPVNKEARPACHRIWSLFTISSSRYHGVRGWPAILGARRYSGLHNALQNFTSKASPDVFASS
jgi:hypothetical protein